MIDENYYDNGQSPTVNPGANHGSGPWAPGYDPGPNWNGGVAPGAPSPRYDYNGGSPPDMPLTAEHGWVWEGPQTPIWNMSTNQWDRGVWQERLHEGLGYVRQTGGPQPPGQPPPTGGGAVPSLPGGSGINVPPSTLPADILGLFNKVPEKTPVQSTYQTALLDYLKRSQETPSLHDAILGPQVDVYRAQQQRNQERNRRAVAERASANGQSQSGYLDQQINKGLQEQALNTASFNANLLGGEMDKRRNELQAGLQLAAATGNQEAERELRARLARVSAAMQQQGLNLQGQLGAGDLALRQLLAQMGNEQFYDQLGVNTQLGLEGLNQRALEIIMGVTR